MFKNSNTLLILGIIGIALQLFEVCRFVIVLFKLSNKGFEILGELYYKLNIQNFTVFPIFTFVFIGLFLFMYFYKKCRHNTTVCLMSLSLFAYIICNLIFNIGFGYLIHNNIYILLYQFGIMPFYICIYALRINLRIRNPKKKISIDDL